MKLIKFLQVARKQGADISRLTIRVKEWHGAWGKGIRILSLRGNRMRVCLEGSAGRTHEMDLAGNHELHRCSVSTITNEPVRPRKLGGNPPALILDLAPPVAKAIDW